MDCSGKAEPQASKKQPQGAGSQGGQATMEMRTPETSLLAVVQAQGPTVFVSEGSQEGLAESVPGLWAHRG